MSTKITLNTSEGFDKITETQKVTTGYFSGGFECNVALGDVNGDAIINILDLVQLSNYLLGISTPTYECAADYNQNGEVNILDLVQIANLILEN